MIGDARTQLTIANGLILVAAVFLVDRGYRWASQQSVFAVRQVVITTPLREVDPGLLESVIRTDLRGTFFTLSPERVRAAVRKLPWVDDVVVSRRWPATIKIALREHRAVAQWGEHEMLSEQGIVFRGSPRERLPRVDAPQVKAAEVVLRLDEVQRTLSALGLELTRLGMTERGALWAEANGRLRIEFGREQFRERLDRFAMTYARWSEQERGSLARIDLRYRNGLAVAHAVARAQPGEGS